MPAISRPWGVRNRDECRDPFFTQSLLDVFANDWDDSLSPLDANHFNFLHANAVPGIQTVEVQAKAAAGVALGGTRLGAAGAEAFVGAGALYVETIRLIKEADGTVELDNLH